MASAALPIELDPLIAEAKQRARRRRLLLAALLLLSAAVVTSTYAIFGGEGNSASSGANGAQVTAVRCNASSLSAVAFFQGATQTELGGISITNTGGVACSLPTGVPRISVSWQGKKLSVTARGMARSTASGKVARALAPGTKALIWLQWWDKWFCAEYIPGGGIDNASFDPRFVLRFAHGLTLAATATGLPMPNCGKPGGWIDVSRPLARP